MCLREASWLQHHDWEKEVTWKKVVLLWESDISFQDFSKACSWANDLSQERYTEPEAPTFWKQIGGQSWGGGDFSPKYPNMIMCSVS